MIKIEHNAQTGEIKEIELTPAEIKQFENMYEQNAEKNDIVQAEAQAKAAAKIAAQKKLEALGLSADDLKALGL